MKGTRDPLKEILELTRADWDHPGERAEVRLNYSKMLACRTPALGGKVFASAACRKVVYYTCKSRCCPSCGNRGTLDWQRDRGVSLPDIPFTGIVFTMPDVFWPVFGTHRHLQDDPPSLGAAVIEQWAWSRYGVRLFVIVIQHTFGNALNYHPHLHMMVSSGGLNPTETRWIESLEFDATEIRKSWKLAVTAYLWKAYQKGLLLRQALRNDFIELIHAELEPNRTWNVHITRKMSKKHFLAYAGRYIRRSPISQRRIIFVSKTEVVYLSKDPRTGEEYETHCSPVQFFRLLSQHVLDRYQHSMRYYGLLAPRTKRLTSTNVFSLLHQTPHKKPQRLRWVDAVKMHYGIDPLIDQFGNRMCCVGRLAPIPGWSNQL
jgi:hypothetical protein